MENNKDLDGLFKKADNLQVKGKWPTVDEIANMVKTGAITDVQRTPFNFIDPAYFDPILFFIQHRDRKELNFRLRYEYEFHPLVQSVISLHSEFPLSDFQFQASESKHSQFYNDFADDIELLPLMMDMLKDYWLLGEMFAHGHWDENGKTWKNFVMYPPEFIDVKGTHVLSDKLYFLEVDSKLKHLVNSQNEVDQALTKNIDPNIVEQIRSKGMVWLRPEQTFSMMRKTSRYDLRGTSPIKAIYKDLMYEHKLRLLQFAYIDRHSSPIKIFKLGNPTSGWIPPASHFETFRQLLAQAANDPDFSLVFHHGISVDYVGTKDKIMNLIPEFEFVEKRILSGMFVNKSIVDSEGSTFANANVAARILMNRYMTIRSMLESIIKNKILKRIAREREYYKKDSNDPNAERINGKYYTLDIPKIKWRKINLLDDTTQKQFLQKMRDAKEVSHKAMCEAMDLDQDEVIEQMKREEGTIVDPSYKDAKDSLSKEKSFAKQILSGRKAPEYRFDNIMRDDKDATPTENKARKTSRPSTNVRPLPKEEPDVAPQNPGSGLPETQI